LLEAVVLQRHRRETTSADYDARVSSRRFAAALLLVALSGCGGGSTPSRTTSPSPPASREAKAVDAWAKAALAYWDDFRNCGSKVTRTRYFFSTCTSRTGRNLNRAKLKVQSAVAGGAGSCRTAAKRLRAVVNGIGTALRGAVRGFDQSNNASLANRSYGGPAPQQLYFRGAGVLEEGIPKARTLSRALDRGC
jgi:hypothetical protein